MRNLEREIASVCRKVAKKVSRDGKTVSVRVTPQNLPSSWGLPSSDTGRERSRTRSGWPMAWRGPKSGENS